jgi:hypothetical protein
MYRVGPTQKRKREHPSACETRETSQVNTETERLKKLNIGDFDETTRNLQDLAKKRVRDDREC